MDITTMKLSKLKEEDSTYDNIMSYIVYKGFDLLFFHKDYRGDEFDDGGFVISISKREGKFYLHVLRVTYNIPLSTHVMTEDDPRIDKDSPEFQEEAFPDFVVFDSFEHAKGWIVSFLEDMDNLLTLEDFEGREAEEFIDYNHHMPRQAAEFMATCYFAYSEYPDRNREALLAAVEND